MSNYDKQSEKLELSHLPVEVLRRAQEIDAAMDSLTRNPVIVNLLQPLIDSRQNHLEPEQPTNDASKSAFIESARNNIEEAYYSTEGDYEDNNQDLGEAA